MKNLILSILSVAACLLASCSSDDLRPAIPSVDDQMCIKPSVADITLDQDLGSETALTFEWGKAHDRGEGTKINYYFKMDLEGSKFENSIDKISIKEGQTSVSFTHKQLNSYLKKWGITPGTPAVVEAEIIAEVQGGDHYMKPEISTTTVVVTGYEIQPRPLYLYSAAGGEGLQMDELISETKYRYTGVLEQGTYNIAKSATDTPVMTISVDHTTYYDLNVDVPTATYTIMEPSPTITQLYVVGSACEIGWDIAKALEMKRDAVNKFKFTYTGNLTAGEIKFPLLRATGWDCDFVMAATADQSIRDSKAVLRNQPDNKWRLTSADAGRYTITIDTYLMTVKFEKQH